MAPPPPLVSMLSLSQSFFVSPVELSVWRGGAGGGGGAEPPYDVEKAWSSVNPSIPSGGR
jgi:hypothetical protein